MRASLTICEIRVVPEQSARVVEHLRIVRIEPAQLERNGDRIAIASEVGVAPLQVETGHTTESGIGRLLVECLFERRQRLVMTADF